MRRPTDEAGAAIEMDRDADRFMHGREGDQFMTTFQCDLCHFRNMFDRSPDPNGTDDLTLKFIRRANLDAMWSRAPGTIKNNRREVIGLYSRSKIFGLPQILPAMGPFPTRDIHGMSVAICVLLRTLDIGKNEATIQYSTAQKMKTAYANCWRASPKGGEGAVVVRDMAKMFHTTCPTHGDWFERFNKGMHDRMGDCVKQDQSISIEQMHALMENYENRWAQATDRVDQRCVLFPALFCIVAFCCGLRGEEVPMMSLTGTRMYSEQGFMHRTTPHVVVALYGRFKNEIGNKYHLMPLVLETATGLKPGLWIRRMIDWYAAEQVPIIGGWVFLDKDNKRARPSYYEWDILSELEKIQEDHPDVIPQNINVYEDYGVSRSFRRGSNTHAVNQNVTTMDIERNNRWRSMENAGSRQARARMIHHYTDVLQLLKALLRYSAPL
jgi:hypothetical protein